MPVLCPYPLNTKGYANSKKWRIVFINRFHDLHFMVIFPPEVFKRNEGYPFKQDIYEDFKVGLRDFCLFHKIRPVFEQLGLNMISGA